MKQAKLLFSLLLAAACANAATPLIDMQPSDLYLGQYQGGLYENGLNTIPSDHAAAGAAIAAAIQPLDASGNPSPAGKIGLMGIGMSNAIQKWCATINAQNPSLPCNSWSFTGQALADTAVNTQSLVLVPGGMGSQVIDTWDDPSDPNWNRVATQVLPAYNVTKAQIQVIWLENANPRPTISLPNANADAYAVETGYANIIRVARQEYPNLKIIFVSSRAYAGHATVTLNPEPYAYETGLAVKWLVQAQVDQMRAGNVVDARAGDLNYNTGAAPWIVWGPYFWADGTNPRSDGLTWRLQDVDPADGTHPSPACPSSCGTGSTNSGEYKAGNMLLQFFKTSPYSMDWFLRSQSGDVTAPQATIINPTQGAQIPVGQMTVFRVDTDEAATCRRAQSDMSYSAMTITLTGAGTTTHTTNLTPPSAQTYNVFVRCQDLSGNTMQSSVNVTFSSTTTPVPKVGDLDGNGRVDLIDVQRVLTVFGQSGVTTGEDVNGDNAVNIYDLIMLARNWG